MKNLTGTNTVENLLKAFAGESQARNRYTYYATTAAQEGFRQIEAIFQETADNEREHAKRFYQLLLAGMHSELPATVNIDASYPIAMKDTLTNLQAAAAGENEEHSVLYPQFANTASQEGFPEVTSAFRIIARVESAHEARFLKLAGNLRNNLVFRKECIVLWKCRNCGYIHEGTIAPGTCPACLEGQEQFEIRAENY
jgi:rubrerythrin